MSAFTRRTLLGGAAIFASGPATGAWAASKDGQAFIDAAFRMKADAVRGGDQPYGAVLVRDGQIIGFGLSRVVLRNDDNAHAEREAIRDAQARVGSSDLSGSVLYSTSRPCGLCEAAAARAKVSRMFFGRQASDAGAPRAY